MESFKRFVQFALRSHYSIHGLKCTPHFSDVWSSFKSSCVKV